MRLHFSHPYNDNISINFGQFTQLVGQNQELKYYIWQLIIWYFNGKKYSEEDLSLFNQVEPCILKDNILLKRNEFQLISISTIQDLLEQMTYKKGTTSFDFMKQKLVEMELMSVIDDINDRLDAISQILNERINLSIGDISYKTDSIYFNPEQLLLKNFSPFFKVKERNISFEFVDNESKLLFFLEMLEKKLCHSTQKVLLVFRNMDDYLTYSSFMVACQKLDDLVHRFPHFFVLIFPSNEGYLYVNSENIEYINICSDYMEHFYDFEFLYNRFIEQYPSNQVPDRKQFVDSIRKISSYLFCQEIDYLSIADSDLITIKILNQLYHYNHKIKVSNRQTSPLELNYLYSTD